MRNVWFAISVALIVGLATSSLAQENRKNFDAILADLSENNLSAEEIQGVASLPSVRIVSLESFSGADQQKLDETLRETEDKFAEIRAAIEANETLEAVLRERGVPVSRIVAVTRTETGTVTIYTGAQSP